jgi:hypothetical protein
MVCLELNFNEINKFDVEVFLTKNRILYFEKSCENEGFIKLNIAEKELDKIESTLKKCRYINQIKNLRLLQEIL